jgi:hypothetical protein
MNPLSTLEFKRSSARQAAFRRLERSRMTDAPLPVQAPILAVLPLRAVVRADRTPSRHA